MTVLTGTVKDSTGATITIDFIGGLMADGGQATLGITTGAAVTTDANGTLQQYLRGLIKQWIAGTLTFASQAYSAAASFTCGTTAYAANDAVGATGAAAALTFAGMGPSGKEILITSASLEIDTATIISGETSYVLHFYNVTPPSAINDSAAWDLVSGDRASYLGSINLGTPVDLGSTLYVATDSINKQIKLSGTDIFAYLVSAGAYTPTARAFKVTLHSVAV